MHVSVSLHHHSNDGFTEDINTHILYNHIAAGIRSVKILAHRLSGVNNQSIMADSSGVWESHSKGDILKEWGKG